MIISYIVNSEEILKEPLKFSFWRAPTNNDYGLKNVGIKIPFQGLKRYWKKSENKIKIKNIIVDKERMKVIYELKMPRVKKFKLEIKINSDAKINIYSSIVPAEEMIRFGMEMNIDREFGEIRWYGRGPHENYWDRKTAADIGVYQMNIKEFITEYIYPQENANRCDTRWLELRGNKKIIIRGKPIIDFTLSPYSTDDLENSKHTYELNAMDTIRINIDHRQKGVGGNNSWGAKPDSKYRLFKNKEYQFEFSIQIL